MRLKKILHFNYKLINDYKNNTEIYNVKDEIPLVNQPPSPEANSSLRAMFLPDICLFICKQRDN